MRDGHRLWAVKNHTISTKWFSTFVDALFDDFRHEEKTLIIMKRLDDDTLCMNASISIHWKDLPKINYVPTVNASTKVLCSHRRFLINFFWPD